MAFKAVRLFLARRGLTGQAPRLQRAADRQPGLDFCRRSDRGYGGRAFHAAAGILNDASMTNAEKRTTLASWAADARAMKDVPALRKLENGVVIRLKDILQALIKLDDDDDDLRPSPAALIFPTMIFHL